MEIKPFEKNYIFEIINLHKNTIRSLYAKNYTLEQLNIWSPKEYDVERWSNSLTKNISLVAFDKKKIVGFGDVKIPQSSLDFARLKRLYVDYDRLYEGIGSQLLFSLENEIRNEGIRGLVVEAVPYTSNFFISKGYRLLRKPSREISGRAFPINIMDKSLVNGHWQKNDKFMQTKK